MKSNVGDKFKILLPTDGRLRTPFDFMTKILLLLLWITSRVASAAKSEATLKIASILAMSALHTRPSVKGFSNFAPNAVHWAQRKNDFAFHEAYLMPPPFMPMTVTKIKRLMMAKSIVFPRDDAIIRKPPSWFAETMAHRRHAVMFSSLVDTDRSSPSSLPSMDASSTANITIIANQTFRAPTPKHISTIAKHQIFHPLNHPDHPDQVFCISSSLCKHGHPQAFGFHPINGPKISSGLFRLSCPLLVKAIDEWEQEGGVRMMSDIYLRQRSNDNHNDTDSDRALKENKWTKSYKIANERNAQIRTELVNNGNTTPNTTGNGRDKLTSKLGEYNADKFLSSGVAGIPPNQTWEVKCIHAHVADHLCRRPPVAARNSAETATNATSLFLKQKQKEEEEEGNMIGKEALQILKNERGISINGNDVCWQQCDGCAGFGKNTSASMSSSSSSSHETTGWKLYKPKKNRQGLRTTRIRRKNNEE